MKKNLITACMYMLVSLICIPAPAVAEEKKTATEPAPANVVFVLSTSLGDITLELDRARAPVSVQNFIDYAEAGFYNGTIFHRVIPNFMIQGGGFTQEMQQKPPREPIKNEAKNGLSNKRGTIAMARTPVVDSATSQFFINLSDNTILDHGVRDFGYAVFGRVIDGMNTVEKIAQIRTGTRGGHQNVPAEPVIITGVSRK